MDSKKLLLLYLILISSALSCSYCYNISNDSCQTLEDKEDIRLEIHTLDGNVYITRNFHVDNDTLYLEDYTRSVGKKGMKIHIKSINYVKACEYNTTKGKKGGLKFGLGVISFFVIFPLLLLILYPPADL